MVRTEECSVVWINRQFGDAPTTRRKQEENRRITMILRRTMNRRSSRISFKTRCSWRGRLSFSSRSNTGARASYAINLVLSIPETSTKHATDRLRNILPHVVPVRRTHSSTQDKIEHIRNHDVQNSIVSPLRFGMSNSSTLESEFRVKGTM